MTNACILISHGTVSELDEIPEFLKNIRRGHAPSVDLELAVRSRYEAIGGRSPLNDIGMRLAKQVEADLGIPCAYAGRLWKPYAKHVVSSMAERGVKTIAVVPLAQFSAGVYVQHVSSVAAELPVEIRGIANWGLNPQLLELFAAKIRAAHQPGSPVLFTAHSLPKFVVDAGDPYEKEVRESVAALLEVLGPAYTGELCFQSQGMSDGPPGKPIEWLGPTLLSTLQRFKERGERSVTIAPIGFLSDHVEVLYDLDIEARIQCKELGLSYNRMQLLNDDPAFGKLLAGFAREALA